MATVIPRKSRHGIRYLAQVRLNGHPPMAQTFDR